MGRKKLVSETGVNKCFIKTFFWKLRKNFRGNRESAKNDFQGFKIGSPVVFPAEAAISNYCLISLRKNSFYINIW